MAKKTESIEVVPDPSAEKQVWKAVDGCVIDWYRSVQVNPKTKQAFDFYGSLIVKE